MIQASVTSDRHRPVSIGIVATTTIALFILAGFCLTATAQQITAAMAGTVKDPQGEVVAGATVKATNVATGFTRATTSGSDGSYRVDYLPVGTYSLDVEAPGFKKFVQQNLVLTVDQTQTLNVTLSVGVQTQTVTVSVAPPLVNTTTAEVGRTVSPREIIGLPLVNRNPYTELETLRWRI